MTIRVGEAIELKHPRRDVNCCAIAKEQTLVATGSQDGNVYLWESAEGSLLMTLAGGHTGDVNSVSFNADASILSSAGEDGRLVFWDLAKMSEKVRHRFLEGHGEGVAINVCLFSPNSTLLATGGKDSDIMLWGNLGRPVCGRLRGHRNWVTCAAFSSDSLYLATGGFDHTVCLWNCTNFSIVQTIRRHAAPVNCVSLSVEGSVSASGDGDGMVLLTRSDGTVLRELNGHKDAVSGIAMVEAYGIVLTCSHDWSVKAWSLRGQCVKSLKAHEGRVVSIAVNSEQDFFTTTADDFLCKVTPFVWDEAGALTTDDIDFVPEA